MIVAGRGAVLAGARDAAEALGDRTGALLATSAMAHGLFAGLPYALGIAGGFASPLAAELLADSDVVVALGATLNHWTTRHGALLAAGARLVQVDVEPAAIGAHQPAGRRRRRRRGGERPGAGGGARRARAPRHGPPHARGRGGDRGAALARRALRGRPRRARSTRARWPSRSTTCCPPDRAVAVDSGAFTGWPAMYLGVADARAWLFCNAFQSVGLALGAALGAAVARPDRVTVAALGDGGLFLSLAELDTAARLGLPVLVVVWDDAAYGAEVHHFGPMGEDAGHRPLPGRRPGRDRPRRRRRRRSPSAASTTSSPWRAWAADPAGPLLVDAKVDPTVSGAWLAEAFRGG